MEKATRRSAEAQKEKILAETDHRSAEHLPVAAAGRAVLVESQQLASAVEFGNLRHLMTSELSCYCPTTAFCKAVFHKLTFSICPVYHAYQLPFLP